jgi:hypothetical protein
MTDTVIINGTRYRPVDEAEASDLARQLTEFVSEGETFWREFFIERDTDRRTGNRFGMYDEGDERAPFFSEAFLYNLLGKDEARSVLGIVRRLTVLAGVEWR